ncbi:MAG: agmatine deiminase family protein [Bacteroidia bacterium]|nr:agmatine deiminase family protein [Bacteroidia bacterium]MDW8158740.1 agmatine deiminase family protein [Bacteroidia bacterium]
MLPPFNYKYVMPAEWYPHAATWLTWPHNSRTWEASILSQVKHTFAQIIAAITADGNEKVNININNSQEEKEIIDLLTKQGVNIEYVQFYEIPSNDAWCRDHGPIFVINSDNNLENPIAITNWEFNSWGNKYPFEQDNQIPIRIAASINLPIFSTGIILEGGSIDVNGEGCLLTTRSCLLNPNRNPHLSQQEIEEHLCSWLGVHKILWLEEGIVGDDTDGHIDDIARFASPSTILYAIETNEQDENFAILQRNYQLLKSFTNTENKPFELIPIPMPQALYYNGARLPATYLNFYITNSAVLVPTFGDSTTEEIALSKIQSVFPDRKIIGIDCRALIVGLGAIHCVTQQQPAL